MSARVKGSNNPMFGKPVTESNKKLISEFFSKSVYLYDANTPASCLFFFMFFLDTPYFVRPPLLR